MPVTTINSYATAEEHRWRAFVDSRPDSTSYHRWEWKEVIERTFGWRTFYLMAETEGRICGVLPLVLQHSWLFGQWMSSMPFLQGGGILAETDKAAHELLNHAVQLMQESNAKYLELRHLEARNVELQVRNDKVKAVLALPSTGDKMWALLDGKVRNLVRKGLKANLIAEFGSLELLHDFYQVFRKNMRDLGTPVYQLDFFAQILRSFPREAFICVVRNQREPVACAFLVAFRDRIESVWASSVRRFRSLSPNMFLYWNLLHFAIDKGYRTFDFGRSSSGSGTQRFKLQWGAQELPLFWGYRSNKPMRVADRHDPKFQLAIRAWQHLPLAIANQIGPAIARHLPS